MRNTLILTCALIAGGCGTMNKEECARSDWEHVGFIDGRMGKVESYINEHRRTCGEKVPVAGAYEEGRLRGLKDYCTPRSIYNEGAQGREFANVCPDEKQAELSKHYDEGRLTYDLKAERDALKAHLEKEREKIEKDRTVVGDIEKVFHLVSGTSATQKEEERIEDLNDKIYLRSSLAPAGKAPVPSLKERIELNPVPAARNAVAIMTGAIFGFGIGHSIQGTYGKQGWKWTAIDAANIAGMVVTSANCSTAEDPATGQRGSKNTGICIGSTVTLAAGLIVSRVWQGIELGKAASHTYSPYSVGILPRDDGGNLLATWIW